MSAPLRAPRRPRAVAAGPTRDSAAGRIFRPSDATLVDLVDNVLNKGLIVTGDVVLSLADVDLVYLRLSALLCAADKVLPGTGQPAAGPGVRRRRR